MKNYRFLILLTATTFPAILRAQAIDSMMNVYADQYPQEKVYLHFDKKIYSPGETLWYKAYIFTGADLSLLSKNFYTELSDAQGNILQRRVSAVLEGTSAGQFDLPDDLKSGHVHIRAYTTWMTNFDTAFYFEKDIRIYRKADSATAGEPMKQDARLQFFPEGGDLVGGVESTLAFKCNDQYGLPVNVKGSIQDAGGKELFAFASEHDGMGKFQLTPEKNDSLIAVWKDPQGGEHRTPLPHVHPSGVVLHVINSNGKVMFSVARSQDAATKRYEIIAHMHQHMIYRAKINLADNFMSGGTIPANQLPTGVLQLTVFNERMQPLAERVVLIDNHNYSFSPDLGVLTKGLSKRGRNNIQILVPDTLRSNFSLAITDAEADGDLPGDDNIISHMLLTGDIRGYVHNPYYYFSGKSDSLTSQLDLVMLTHGWRRFKWDQLAQGKLPVIKNPEQNYLAMRVEALGVDPYKISHDESLIVILSKKDSSQQMLQVPHVSGGKFGLGGLFFYDTAKAYYSFNLNHKLSSEAAITFSNGLLRGGRMSKPLTIAHDGWTPDELSFFKRVKVIDDEIARVRPLEEKRAKTLATVIVRARERSDKEKLDEKYTSGLFSGGDATIFDMDKDPYAVSMPDIFSYLQGKVAGLQIVTGQGPGGAPSLSWRGGTPSLYLNEMQVDAQTLQSTPVSDIAMVKVFRPGMTVGMGGGAGGSIAVYTKKGLERQPDPSAKGLDHTILVGYSPIKEFYVPNYDPQSPPVEAEDLRSTLYWRPFVLTGADNKKVDVHFYNNDITHRIRVVLEGVNEDGKLCHIEKILQ